jgi:hypothetical protein
MISRAVLGLAVVLAAPAAQAGLSSHSVSYEVKLPADADKAVRAEGQGNYSLIRSCQGWTVGDVYQFTIDKGAPAGGKPGAQADRLEERLTATEALDVSQFAYQARWRLNARNTAATVKATLDAAGGTLRADLGGYSQSTDLPAGTLPPAAARAALVDALLANQPDPIEIKTVELVRFHKPIVERFQRLPPEFKIPTALPKELRTSDKDFAKGRTFAVRRRVGDLNEFGDEFWLLHESGAILRRLIKRQNVDLLLEAREVTLFPPPKCD